SRRRVRPRAVRGPGGANAGGGGRGVRRASADLPRAEPPRQPAGAPPARPRGRAGRAGGTLRRAVARPARRAPRPAPGGRGRRGPAARASRGGRGAAGAEDARSPVLLPRGAVVEALPRHGARLVVLDEGDLDTAGAEENPDRVTTADHLAYVIYTSGSTGKPKG